MRLSWLQADYKRLQATDYKRLKATDYKSLQATDYKRLITNWLQATDYKRLITDDWLQAGCKLITSWLQSTQVFTTSRKRNDLFVKQQDLTGNTINVFEA